MSRFLCEEDTARTNLYWLWVRWKCCLWLFYRPTYNNIIDPCRKHGNKENHCFCIAIQRLVGHSIVNQIPFKMLLFLTYVWMLTIYKWTCTVLQSFESCLYLQTICFTFIRKKSKRTNIWQNSGTVVLVGVNTFINPKSRTSRLNPSNP